MDLFKNKKGGLPCSKENILEEKVIEDILEIYNAISGEKRIKENCKLILS